jgi:hypothetical protein
MHASLRIEMKNKADFIFLPSHKPTCLTTEKSRLLSICHPDINLPYRIADILNAFLYAI